ncbi:SPOR domain-containing protein [Tabrizicola aquatica]|uniref:SPOR domain-containing protein n=1 Tax=Tabrizicola aquatica TaxID=909926 RepID=UPI000CD190AF|nr:SPOR domain-containing protein [Tabrizicola aquatica]
MADADFDGLQGYGRTAGPKAARLVTLAGAVASVALVVGMGVWGYQLAVRDVRGVPVIQALEGPMRIAPADPGGEIADHQGLAVNTVAAVGVAAPPPEKLILAPRPVDLAEEDTAGLAGLSPLPPELAAATAVAAPASAADLAVAAAPPTESASPTEVAIDAALAEALGEIPPEALEPVAALPDVVQDPVPAGAMAVSPRPKARPGSRAAPEPQPAVALEAPNEIDPATIPAGTRLVQFGAFDTEDQARAEWVRLSGQFGELMGGKGMVLQPAESGGRTFYRLRAHGFDDEADARRFCSAFVAQSATCIPVPQR